MSTIRRLLWPRHRWRKVAVVIFAALLGVVAYGWYQTRPARLIPRVEAMLHNHTGAQVRVDNAEVAWGPKLVIEGLGLSVPGVEGRGGRVLDAEHVEVGISLLAALRGDLTPTTFAAHHPVLYLTEDANTGIYNVQQLRLPDGPATDVPPPKLLPESLIRGGEIRIAELRDGGYHLLGTIDVVGRLTETADEPDVYRFQLAGREVGTQEKVSLAGTIDVEALSIDVRLDGLRVGSVHRRLLPGAYRAWHEAIRPEGELRDVTLQLGPDENGRLVPKSARMEVSGVALSLPAELLGLGEDDYEIRMQDVQGVTRWTQGVIHDRFTGTIEGVGYTLVGTHGLGAADPFDLTLATDVFDLPEDPRFFFALPPIAKVYHDRFRPSGKFKTTVRLWREEAGGAVHTDGVVEVVDARASYKRFPYPVQHIGAGRLRFTDDAVTIEDLQAVGPTGAQVTVAGRIAPPTDDAQVDVTVALRDMPIDTHLTGAMLPRHRSMADAFFDTKAYTALLDAGLLRASGDVPDEPARMDVPTFGLGGTVQSGTVSIHRPYGEEQDYNVTIDMDVSGLGLLFTHWPYPLTSQSGRLVLGDDEARIQALELVGPTGAAATLNGSLDRSDPSAIKPELAITGLVLPIDDLLLASIPSPQDRWVRLLHLGGSVTGTGRVFVPEAPQPKIDAEAAGEPRIDLAFSFEVADGSARPHNGGYALTDGAGRFELTRDGLTMKNVTAKREQTAHTFTGAIDWSGDEPAFDLHLTAADMVVDQAMLDLAPPDHPAVARAAAMFETYKPQGLADVTAHWASDAEGDTFDLRFKPKRLAFSIDDQRLTMSDMSGELRVHPGYLALDRVKASFPEGTGSLSGVVGLGETSTSVLFEASASEVGATTRALLPDAALTVLDALDLRTGYDIRSASLTHRPPTHADPGTQFKGVIALEGASASIGVAVSEFDGLIGVTVNRPTGRSAPLVDLKLHSDRLLLDEREVTRLSLRLHSDARDGSIRLDDLRGSMYGGIIIGQGLVVPGEAGWYAANLTMHEVALEPFLKPELGWEPVGEPADGEDWLLPHPLRRRERSGLVSASLSVEAPLDGSGRREGRGAIEVHDASLFSRPLSLALLQASNLRLPQSSSLDRLSGRFVVVDDTVHFDSLSFNARYPNLTITGTGAMDWPTRKLDLTMYNRNPEGWQLGPLNDLFNSIKDELMVIRVGGSLDQPSANVESFSGLRRTWDDLFGQAKARVAAPGEIGRD